MFFVLKLLALTMMQVAVRLFAKVLSDDGGVDGHIRCLTVKWAE